MKITINIKDLIYAIRDTSHNEVAVIKDVQERYKAEAGLDKLELIKQCIMEAYSNVLATCYRFVSGEDMSDYDPALLDASETIDGHTEIGISDFEFELVGGMRRFGENNIAIANKIKEALKDYALSSFYTAVSQMALSTEHMKRATADIAALSLILRNKRPPVSYTGGDPTVRVTPEEKEKWNDKLNVDDDMEVVGESLVFNRL